MGSLPSLGRTDKPDRRARQLEALTRVVTGASAPTERPTREGHPHARRARQLDVAAIGLVVLLGGWAVVAATGRDQARPTPVLLLVASSVLAAGAGRAAGHRYLMVVPSVVAVGIAGAFVLTLPEVWTAGGAPTGYANANACLAALGTIAAIAASSLAPTEAGRRGFAILAAVLLGAVIATGSVAAVLVLAVTAALAAGAVATKQAALAVVGGLVAVSIALGATAAIAEGSDLFGLRERSGVRGDLWAEAAHLVAESSLRGVGTGTFASSSALSTDADLRWAHHDHLQLAAEQGVVGLVLLLALVGCGFVRLWVGHRHRVSTLAGAAALTVVALHATVDHVLYQAAVPLTLAVLVGWATGDRRPGRGNREVIPTTVERERAAQRPVPESPG